MLLKQPSTELLEVQVDVCLINYSKFWWELQNALPVLLLHLSAMDCQVTKLNRQREPYVTVNENVFSAETLPFPCLLHEVKLVYGEALLQNLVFINKVRNTSTYCFPLLTLSSESDSSAVSFISASPFSSSKSSWLKPWQHRQRQCKSVQELRLSINSGAWLLHSQSFL